MPDDIDLNTVELATELTVAWLGNHNNRVAADDVPVFLAKMHETVGRLAGGKAAPPAADADMLTPAVSARRSLASPNHIISMIDGKPYKALRRHLSANGLTPAEYRHRYNLKSDYPMVAPAYSKTRREMAQKIGLGRKPKAVGAEAETAPPADAKPSRRPRSKKGVA